MNPLNLSPLQKKMIREVTIVKNFYSKNPDRRASYGGSCSYQTPHGNKCAVGRILNKKDMEYLDREGMIDGTSIHDVFEYLTTKRVTDLPVTFWEKVQSFHDDDEHWNNEGITEEGLRYFNSLLEDIKAGLKFY